MKRLSVALPTGIAVLSAILMYVGEMILLSGNLYRFGHRLLFDGLGKLVLAPIDIFVVAASGCITAWISCLLNRNHSYHKKDKKEELIP